MAAQRLTLLITANLPEAQPLLDALDTYNMSDLRLGADRRHYSSTSEDGSVRILVTGMGPQAARDGLEGALNAIEVPIACAIGFGVAGGLVKTAGVGQVILPTTLVYDRKEMSPTEWLRMRMASLVSVAPLRKLMTTDQLVSSPAKKAALFAATGAEAVDMESGVWGRMLDERKIPWAIVRSILDPASETLSERLALLSDRFGNVKWADSVRTMLRHPSEIQHALTLFRRMRGEATEPYVLLAKQFLDSLRKEEGHLEQKAASRESTTYAH